jgi:CubicO group peptidase (beta-lactamase class C family)
MKKTVFVIVAACLLGSIAIAEQAPVMDAVASDPVKLGWMQGTPPAPDKIIGLDDGGYRTFPKTRWSYPNWRQYVQSMPLRRGATPVYIFARAEIADIDALTFTPIGGTEAISWEDALAANYTDGIVVLHKGRIVYERYFGVTTPATQHIAFSVTKSFVGTLAASLVAEGKLDPEKPVTYYVPELANSGFAGATVRHVMDMTTGIAFDENYTNPNSDIARYAVAGRAAPRPTNYTGPDGFLAFLPTIGANGEHGERFTYRTANTDVLGWIAARAGGAPLRDQLEDRFWSQLGMEQDAAIQVDAQGTAFGGGGLMPALRDMARFGEMMRLGGQWNGKQIVPEAAIADIVKGGGKSKFAKNGAYPTLPGWSYRNQWWVSHNEHGAYSARGVHGQAIYIDPKAEMVIARFASHPLAGNVKLDPTSLPAYHALAKHLMER